MTDTPNAFPERDNPGTFDGSADSPEYRDFAEAAAARGDLIFTPDTEREGEPPTTFSASEMAAIERLKVANEALNLIDQFRADNPEADEMIAAARATAWRRHQATHIAASGWAWVRRSADCEQCRLEIDPQVWNRMQFAARIADLLAGAA